MALATRVALLVASLLLPACTGSSTPSPGDPWERLSVLPTGAAPVALSSGHGAVLLSGETEARDVARLPVPVLFASRDGRQWNRVALAPATHYGEHAGLRFMTTDAESAAMVGQRSGGAHGIPRFTTWTGTFRTQTETAQPFELFGGPSSLGVVGLAGSGSDALAVGGWAGPRGSADIAVWRLADHVWVRHDGVEVFRSNGNTLRRAHGVARSARGYLLVGAVTDLTDTSPASRAAMWTLESRGTWSERRLPGTAALAANCPPHLSYCLVLGVTASRLSVWRIEATGRVSEVDVPLVPAGATSRAWLCVSRSGSALAGLRRDASGTLLIATGGRWRVSSGPRGRPAGVACTDERLLALVDGPSRELWALDR